VRIGFVTVLRAGIVGAVTVVALLAVFTLDRNMVILIMIGFGAAMGVTLTPLAALGVIQAPEDEPGSLRESATPRSVSAARSDSPGPEQLSGRGQRRPITRRCGSASPSASPPLRPA
jgi:hypothetical protein